MKNKSDSQIHGIKIRTFNTCIIILSCISFLFLIATTAGLSVKYHQLIEQTNQYMACEEKSAMLTQGSDYLTEQVRLYAQNMDVKYMDAYFEEVNVTQRRDKALKELDKLHPNKELRENLQSALKSSNALMQREIYSMKLISVANGYNPSILPEEVSNMPLTAEDSSLEPEEMINKARELVFDDGYQDAKALIYSHLSHFADNITGAVKENHQQSEESLADLIFFQRILISILFVLNLLTFVVITTLIVKPLSIHIKRIKENSTLKIIGSYEFKYLALTYNDIYELNDANKKILEHKAEHDALTGLLNRATFDSLKDFLKESTMPLALALIDVDKFKNVNDLHGHNVGDRVLETVAALLTKSFRSNDYIIRFGGDEFVVLMTDITASHKDTIKAKFDGINALLSTQNNDIPKVSISVGVAFSENGFDDVLFEKADQALYDAKNAGRNQCRFYQDSNE